MKKFQEFMGKRELLLEMAKLGEIDALALIIWTRDPGNIPHIHIVDVGTEGDKFDCCIRLDKAEYFKHGSHQDKLNSKQRKSIALFMRSKIDEDADITNYEFAVRSWNTNNPDRKLTLKRDENKNILIPDYTKLT